MKKTKHWSVNNWNSPYWVCKDQSIFANVSRTKAPCDVMTPICVSFICQFLKRLQTDVFVTNNFNPNAKFLTNVKKPLCSNLEHLKWHFEVTYLQVRVKHQTVRKKRAKKPWNWANMTFMSRDSTFERTNSASFDEVLVQAYREWPGVLASPHLQFQSNPVSGHAFS